jgi:hypothetical protein
MSVADPALLRELSDAREQVEQFRCAFQTLSKAHTTLQDQLNAKQADLDAMGSMRFLACLLFGLAGLGTGGFLGAILF